MKFIERNYQIENLKYILIFCVVFGHLLEFMGGGYNLYKIIYSFHMPIFIFINGWLAPQEYASKRIIFKLIYPYGFFQIVYQLFVAYVINEGKEEFSVQFGMPCWLLWYLLTLIFYYLFIPMIVTESRKYARVILGGTILLAIVIGFDNSVGYYMSLSRTFVFLPFFVCGYYVGHGVFRINDVIQSVKRKKIVKLIAIILIFIICSIMFRQNLNSSSLYGSLSYDQGEFLWHVRLEMIVVAFAWIGIFMTLVPDGKILGRLDTFPIYVMHGFVVLYLKKHNPFLYTLPVNMLIASLICIMIMMLFGNKYISRMTKFFFRGEWIIKIWDKAAMKRNI